jgi:hypothetical protein
MWPHKIHTETVHPVLSWHCLVADGRNRDHAYSEVCMVVSQWWRVVSTAYTRESYTNRKARTSLKYHCGVPLLCISEVPHRVRWFTASISLLFPSNFGCVDHTHVKHMLSGSLHLIRIYWRTENSQTSCMSRLDNYTGRGKEAGKGAIHSLLSYTSPLHTMLNSSAC